MQDMPAAAAATPVPVSADEQADNDSCTQANHHQRTSFSTSASVSSSTSPSKHDHTDALSVIEPLMNSLIDSAMNVRDENDDVQNPIVAVASLSSSSSSSSVSIIEEVSTEVIVDDEIVFDVEPEQPAMDDIDGDDVNNDSGVEITGEENQMFAHQDLADGSSGARQPSNSDAEPEVVDLTVEDAADAPESVHIRIGKRIARRDLDPEAIAEERKQKISKNVSIVEQLQGQLNCPVCLHIVSKMASTTCGHVFCYRCIRKAVDLNHRCPVCREFLYSQDVHRLFF